MRNKTALKYTRIARFYELFEWPLEIFHLQSLRKEVIAKVAGKVLEVGVGTGKNLPLYPPDTDLTGIDFSSGMLEIAREKQQRLALQNCTLVEMDIEDMRFESNTFDTVVSTFVFCTVPHPQKGLHELYRVLKPGGKAIFLEHMKSRSQWLNAALWFMERFSIPSLGTSMLRETQKGIEKAGFTVLSSHNKIFDVLRLIVATKEDSSPSSEKGST